MKRSRAISRVRSVNRIRNVKNLCCHHLRAEVVSKQNGRRIEIPSRDTPSSVKHLIRQPSKLPNGNAAINNTMKQQRRRNEADSSAIRILMHARSELSGYRWKLFEPRRISLTPLRFSPAKRDGMILMNRIISIAANKRQRRSFCRAFNPHFRRTSALSLVRR